MIIVEYPIKAPILGFELRVLIVLVRPRYLCVCVCGMKNDTKRSVLERKYHRAAYWMQPFDAYGAFIAAGGSCRIWLRRRRTTQESLC